ncbi:MAG: hypothetical protein D6B27_01595 [Gammaproteobacteria bacterium]|mgnify:CR=1 FL=1|nr:MAG: hypothetical protein D6B27_01595 [Gammaproteobacteria bacterium]
MEIDSILHEIREDYLKHFKKVIADIGEVDCLRPEEVMVKECGTVALSGPIRLPKRRDITIINADESDVREIIVKPEITFDFCRKEFLWKDKLKVIVSPFSWHECLVELSGLSQSSRWNPLKEWFDRWFNIEDRIEDCIFIGAAHEIKGPRVKGEKVEFAVDFGTSPVSAFHDFLDTLVAMGYNKVILGSSSS